MSSVEAMDSLEVAPVAPNVRTGQSSGTRRSKARKAKQAANVGAKPSSAKKKKNQPGKYSQLVIDVIRELGERSGSSLARVYAEARKVDWFDQEHGRTYLKYSVKALVQNDTLLQVKGTGANGSFKLNKNKLEKKAAEEKGKPKPSPSVEKAKPAAPKGRSEGKRKGRKEKSKKAKHSKKSVTKAMVKGKKSTKAKRV